MVWKSRLGIAAVIVTMMRIAARHYTKQLVSSVKQLMRVMWLEAKKHFPKTPSAYWDIIPYPSDAKYDPTTHPFEVDGDLFVQDEDGHSASI